MCECKLCPTPRSHKVSGLKMIRGHCETSHEQVRGDRPNHAGLLIRGVGGSREIRRSSHMPKRHHFSLSYNTGSVVLPLPWYLGCGNKLTMHPCSGPGCSMSRRWAHGARMGSSSSIAAATLISHAFSIVRDKTVGGAAFTVLLVHTTHVLTPRLIMRFCLTVIDKHLFLHMTPTASLPA